MKFLLEGKEGDAAGGLVKLYDVIEIMASAEYYVMGIDAFHGQDGRYYGIESRLPTDFCLGS